MNKKEDILWSIILLVLLFSTAMIMFTAQAYQEAEAYVPIEREWHSPYPTGQSNE